MKRVIAGYLIELVRLSLLYELHCDSWEGTHKYTELVTEELMAKLTLKDTCSIYKKVRQDSRLVKSWDNINNSAHLTMCKGKQLHHYLIDNFNLIWQHLCLIIIIVDNYNVIILPYIQ